jgi:hypothetical protein
VRSACSHPSSTRSLTPTRPREPSNPTPQDPGHTKHSGHAGTARSPPPASPKGQGVFSMAAVRDAFSNRIVECHCSLATGRIGEHLIRSPNADVAISDIWVSSRRCRRLSAHRWQQRTAVRGQDRGQRSRATEAAARHQQTGRRKSVGWRSSRPRPGRQPAG